MEIFVTLVILTLLAIIVFMSYDRPNRQGENQAIRPRLQVGIPHLVHARRPCSGPVLLHLHGILMPLFLLLLVLLYGWEAVWGGTFFALWPLACFAVIWLAGWFALYCIGGGVIWCLEGIDRVVFRRKPLEKEYVIKRHGEWAANRSR